MPNSVNQFHINKNKVAYVFDPLSPITNQSLGIADGKVNLLLDPNAGDTTVRAFAPLLTLALEILSPTTWNFYVNALLIELGSGGGGGGSAPSNYIIVDGDVAQLTSDILYTSVE